jgi:hypothetical protein
MRHGTTDHWETIAHTHSAQQAVMLATSIAAMEFDVHMRDAVTGERIEAFDDLADGSFRIEVREQDAHDLRDLLDEIIDEQNAFDAKLDRREQFEARIRRIVLLIITIIVAILAVGGLIEL